MGSLAVLDLFSGAAGGWSLGMHRAGFDTIAACEAIEWRRAMFAINNPGAKVYDDVRTLTAARLLADLGSLPRIVVGSPPCQGISAANPRGRGIEPFAAFGEYMEVETEGFSDTDRLNLVPEESDVVIGDLFVADFRRARSLTQKDKSDA